jgi:hypothetical protein
MGQRVAIDKYLDFRFRSFAVITPEDEAKYYREVYVPEFRRRFPGLLMPNLDEKRGNSPNIDRRKSGGQHRRFSGRRQATRRNRYFERSLN